MPMLHCNMKLEWQDSHASTSSLTCERRGIADLGEVGLVLWPALQCGATGIGQHVDAAFGAVEPAIDVVQQDLSGIGNGRSEVANAAGPRGERRGAGQRLLAIGGHDR